MIPHDLISRRRLLKNLSTGVTLGSLTASVSAASHAQRRPPVILLRSSWQTVNIGDIAHTPGVLAVLERELPDAEVRLWPSRVDNGVREMLLSRFPHLKIVEGNELLDAAYRECDFLLHGSGPSLVAQRDVQRWSEATGKPYGVFGITLSRRGSTATADTEDSRFQATVNVLSGASFVYFRDSVSLQLAKDSGCTCPLMEFGPDGAFAVDLADDDRADQFLEQNGLNEGGFVCCIPRLRYTPYWTIPSKKAAFDPVRHARNEAMKQHDHEPHRLAITRIARETDLKILVCPEDQTQMRVGKELLVDPLPDDVRRRVVHRPDYWLTGEAVSVYRRSSGLFGNEQHSPIMCIGNGIPAVVCRWAEQTSKGFMWKDIGLQEWLFDFDNEDDVRRLPETVFRMVTSPDESRQKAAAARDYVRACHRRGTQAVARAAQS